MSASEQAEQASKKGKKRKRTKNTMQERYEHYLHFMENDYIFRSSTINPTLEPDYMNKKWEELTSILNAIGNGPALNVDDWKRRFTDWKYNVKTKARKISEHAMKTGAGPKLKLELSNTEERALGIWGKVTVAGANVTGYQGIEIAVQPEAESHQENIEDYQVLATGDEENGSIILTNEIEQPIQRQELPPEVIQMKTPKNKNRTRRERVKPLSILAQNLINNSENVSNSAKEMSNIIETFGNNYLSLEREKFKFEVAKFKFFNKDFDYEPELL